MHQVIIKKPTNMNESELYPEYGFAISNWARHPKISAVAIFHVDVQAFGGICDNHVVAHLIANGL